MDLSWKGKHWREPSLNLCKSTNVQDAVNAIANLRGLRADDSPVAWQFPDLEKAKERLERGMESGEIIGIFGDYDCDGVTGTALLLRLLRARGVRPVVRLPHRANEGYGLKKQHVEEMLRRNVTLLITIDTGIGCPDEVALAMDQGCDVMVLDHHHIPPRRAQPLAVMHPGLSPSWQGAHPAAAGVAWALVSAMRNEQEEREKDEDAILAMWGTIADLVPLRDGNRTLVRRGLEACVRVQDGPLAALLAQAGLSGTPSARDIAFRVAPRINAAGRMADPMIALKAVLGDTQSLQSLEQLNGQRQATVQYHWDSAWTSMDCDDGFLFLKSDDYTPGIVGLIAGKLTEAFGKPSLVASVQGDVCTASLRSIPAYDVTAALQRHAQLLSSFGGHAQAAGCTFPLTNAHALRRALCEDVGARLSAQDLVPVLGIDAEIASGQLTTPFVEALATLEPHGQGNDQPRFLLRDVSLNDVRTMGQNGAHLQASIDDVRCVGFGLGNMKDRLAEPCDIVCTVGMQEWQGRTSVQVMIEDVRVAKMKSEKVGK